MTKFINCSSSKGEQKKTKFHYCIVYPYGLQDAMRLPESFEEVRYLGTDSNGQDLFLAIDSRGQLFYLGTKGSEFD